MSVGASFPSPMMGTTQTSDGIACLGSTGMMIVRVAAAPDPPPHLKHCSGNTVASLRHRAKHWLLSKICCPTLALSKMNPVPLSRSPQLSCYDAFRNWTSFLLRCLHLQLKVLLSHHPTRGSDCEFLLAFLCFFPSFLPSLPEGGCRRDDMHLLGARKGFFLSARGPAYAVSSKSKEVQQC